MLRYAYQELRFFLLWYYFDGPINKLVTRLFVKGVRKAVKDQELAEKLIPTYVLGCKRILTRATKLFFGNIKIFQKNILYTVCTFFTCEVKIVLQVITTKKNSN